MKFYRDKFRLKIRCTFFSWSVINLWNKLLRVVALSTSVEILKLRWNVFLKDLLHLKCTDLGKLSALHRTRGQRRSLLLSFLD